MSGASALPGQVTLPLAGFSVACLAHGGRAAAHAARLMADMGADILFEDARLDPVAAVLLGRPPAIRIAAPGDVAESLVGGGVFALLTEQPVDENLRGLIERSGVNHIDLPTLAGHTFPSTDVAAQAISGVASAIGERHRPPLWFPHRMGEYIQGVNACGMALLLALSAGKGRSGSVALADVWAYAAGIMDRLCTPKGIRYFRDGRRSPGNGGVYPQRLFRAKDGWITLLCRSAQEWASILEGLGSPDWGDNPRYRDILKMAQLYPDEVDRLVEAETEKYTRAELFAKAIEHGFPLAPVRSPIEALGDEYLARQNFWAEHEGVRLPGPLWRRETWQAVYEGGEQENPKPRQRPSGSLPLGGYRVLDLSWVWAGPMVGSFLADLGADVVKVEHGKRLDNMRLRGRLPSNIPNENKHIDPREIDPLFHNVNRGKRSLLLDMKAEEGRALFLRLVAESDIVLESFRPHVLESWGLGFEELKRVNPKIVLLSMRGLELGESFGASGLRSYAPVTSALCGLEHAVRYEGEPDPVGAMAIGVSDPVAGWTGSTLLLGALLHAARTGTGGWIRLSQLETLSSVLPEMFLQAQRPDLFGHDGVTRGVACADGDLIIQGSDIVWRKLEEQGTVTCDNVDLRAGPLLETMIAVEAAGGFAAPVLGVEAHERWIQLAGHAVQRKVAHSLTGEEWLLGHGWVFDGEPVLPQRNAPVIGMETSEILTEYLQMPQNEIEQLRASGVLS